MEQVRTWVLTAGAVVLALLGVPDRARRDIDDWEALRNLDDLA